MTAESDQRLINGAILDVLETMVRATAPPATKKRLLVLIEAARNVNADDEE